MSNAGAQGDKTIWDSGQYAFDETRRWGLGRTAVLLLTAWLSLFLTLNQGQARVTIWNVSSTAELNSALNSAKAGDTISVASGNYGTLDLSGRQYSGYVTITSADGQQGAVFTSIKMEGTSHVRIDGVHVDSGSNLPYDSIFGLVTINNSNHVEVLNSEINGLVDDNYVGGVGVRVLDSSDVLVEKNYIHDLSEGSVVLHTSNFGFIGNTIDYVREEGIKLSTVTNVMIENNTGPRYFFGEPGDHQDFIQFSGSSSYLTIRGNVILPASDPTFQGIFLDDGNYNHVLIEQNIIYNDNLRGISVSAGSDITVRHNTTLSVPGGAAKASIISLPAGSVNYGNISSNTPGVATIGTNIIVQHDDPNGIAYYDDFFTNARRGVSITLEDLMPVAGSPADLSTGMGAAARMAELLLGGAAVNAAPSAADDSVQVAAGGSVIIAPLANDTDANGDQLSIQSLGSPAHGTVSLGANGQVTYRPAAGYTGADSFTYVVSDGRGGSDTGRVTVQVIGADTTPPVAADDSVSTRTGTAVTFDVLANDRDDRSGPLTVTVDGAPEKGTLEVLGNGVFRYTPSAGKTGADSFTYTLRDAAGNTDRATVAIEVLELGLLAPPTFDTGPFSFNGSVASAVVLPHEADMALASGTIELAFTASRLVDRQALLSKDSSGFDGGGHLMVVLEGDGILIRLQSTSASHEIRVPNKVVANEATHLALVFGPGGMKVYVDGALAGSNSYTGGLADNAEPIVIGANQWRSGDGVADMLEHAFNGVIDAARIYAVAFTADDVARLASSDAPAPVNVAPDARDDAAVTEEGKAVAIDVRANDADADGDALSITDVGQAGHGTVTLGADGKLLYTPQAGFSGADSFTYIVSDGALTDTATVRVTVDAAPPAGPVTVEVASAAGLLAALAAAAPGTTIVLQDGDYGSVRLAGYDFADTVTIIAETKYGAKFDSLEISASSNLHIEGIHVGSSTDGARYTSLVTITDASHDITFVGNEVNGRIDGSYDGAYGVNATGGSYAITIANNHIHDVFDGVVVFGGSGLTVSGNVIDYVGADAMVFSGISNALIENNIGPTTFRRPNDAAHTDFIQFQGSSSKVILRGNVMLLKEAASTVQGIFLKDGAYTDFLIEQNLIYTNTVNGIFIQSNAGTGGNISILHNTVLTNPDLTFWGDTDIRIVSVAGSYTVRDNIVDRVVDQVGTGNVGGNLQLQWENASAANHYDDIYAGASKGTEATLANFRPVAGGPADGPGALGADQTIADLLAIIDVGNTPPSAADDTAASNGAPVTIDVLRNDGDADGDALAVASSTQPSHGAVVLNADGTFRYTPQAGYAGSDSFRYTVSDGNGGTSSAVVRIEISPAGGLPSPVLTLGPYAFDGATRDAGVVPHSAALALASGTLEIVFQTDKATGLQTLVSKDAVGYGSGGHFTTWLDGNDIVVRLQSGSASHEIRVADSVIVGAVHQLAVSFGAGGLNVHLDGDLFGSRSYTGGLSGNSEILVVGASQMGSSSGTTDGIANAFDGTIARVGFYGQELSAAQIRTLGEGIDALLLGKILGTAGADILTGTAAGEFLTAGDGDDSVYGGGGSDVLYGGAGNDFLLDYGGSSRLYGGDGDDGLNGGGGADAAFGGAGSDTMRYASSAGAVDADLVRGTGLGGDADGDTYSDIEHLVGSNAGDRLAGDGGANRLSGLDGNDALLGGGSDDMLTGGAGADSLDGGTGLDTADYSDSGAGIDIGFARLGSSGTAAGDSMIRVERILGSSLSDTLVGSAAVAGTLDGAAGNDTIFDYDAASLLIGGDGWDVIVGNGGDDVILGGGGTDWLSFSTVASGVGVDLGAGTGNLGEASGDRYAGIEHLVGSSGNDRLTGDSSDNSIVGGAGNDVIAGGGSNDMLSGGLGADIFVISTAAWGRDVISDWEDGLDRIDLRGSGLTFASFQEITTPQGVRLDYANGGQTHAIHLFGANALDIDQSDFLV